MNWLWVFLMPFVAILMGLIYQTLARKITARIHNRYGPPVWQNILDTLKLLGKRRNITHGVMFSLGPIMAVGGMALSLLFIPVAGQPLLSAHGDMFLVLYLVVIAPLGMALAAGEAANPNATIGIARALTVMLGYEVAFAAAVLSAIIYYGTANPLEMVRLQAGGPAHWGLWPLIIPAIAAEIAMQGMLGEKPFDQAIAPHEIASGPMVEFGGKYLGFLMIFKSLAIITETGIFTVLFLGGGNWWSFWLKTFTVFAITVLINGVMPRLRIGKALSWYWKAPAIIGVLGLLVAYLGRM